MRALTLALATMLCSSTVCGQGRARRPQPPPQQPQQPPARPPPWRTIEMFVGQEEGIDATGVRSYSETGGITEVRLAPDGTHLIVRAVVRGQMTLLLLYANGEERRVVIIVR